MCPSPLLFARRALTTAFRTERIFRPKQAIAAAKAGWNLYGVQFFSDNTLNVLSMHQQNHNCCRDWCDDAEQGTAERDPNPAHPTLDPDGQNDERSKHENSVTCQAIYATTSDSFRRTLGKRPPIGHRIQPIRVPPPDPKHERRPPAIAFRIHLCARRRCFSPGGRATVARRFNAWEGWSTSFSSAPGRAHEALPSNLVRPPGGTRKTSYLTRG